MSQLVRDVRFALRSMAKSPGVSLLMVGTLAVGLAANGIIFNVLDAMVLHPLSTRTRRGSSVSGRRVPAWTTSTARTWRRPTSSIGRPRRRARWRT